LRSFEPILYLSKAAIIFCLFYERLRFYNNYREIEFNAVFDAAAMLGTLTGLRCTDSFDMDSFGKVHTGSRIENSILFFFIERGKLRIQDDKKNR